ncbi:Two component system response regulator/histidine kinase [Desulfonema limicola]|uniref:histidine kinase n=1 Tax=Desulfonema limicola TaxID=45656 RepID=A0A975BBA1_9BACT|nr:hybrid sensor histidine kinase/response regulator [Desulfonema limicola]QTA82105.1 Two component system response regulator/histidine kinase [Desulfonema limicola]
MFNDLKILVVDDDNFVKAILTEILESEGCIVKTAEHGIDGLEKYAENPDIDLIISDMNMPEMDGLSLIKELRARQADVPIIILTVNTEIDVALNAIRHGANDYLLKDENIQDTILISVERVIEKYQLKKQNLMLMADLEQKNSELEKSNQELIELNIQKNKFLGIAAHDLRGPLSGIIGMSELLMDPEFGTMNEEQIQYLNMIYTVSNGMINLLDDLLDVSIIESGRLETVFEKNNLKNLLDERIKLFRFAAEKKNIKIFSDFAQVPEIMFDNKRIAQVIDNLMTNAIKFSPQNSNIYVSLLQENDMIKVSVRDQGPGISEQDQSRLFGEFQKLSARPTGGETSTGLGLAIVKKIIDSHHGISEVHSTIGQGAEFSFKIPMNIKNI